MAVFASLNGIGSYIYLERHIYTDKMDGATALFDIDGTLCTVWPLHEKAYESTISELYNIPRVNFRTAYVPGNTNKYTVRTNLEHLGCPKEFIDSKIDKVPEVIARYYEQYINTADITVLPGVVNLLGCLRSEGFRTGVVTGNASYIANLMLKKAGLFHYFSGLVVTADDGETRERRMLIALRRMGRHKRRSVFYFDDSNASIKVSRKLGIIPIAVATGEISYTELLRNGPDHTFKNLRETQKVIEVIVGLRNKNKSKIM